MLAFIKHLKVQRSLRHYSIFGAGLIFSLLTHASFASTIVIHGNKVITGTKTYNNVTLDLTHGRFSVQTGGSLTIKNSIINATISPDNRFAFREKDGRIELSGNTVNVTVDDIDPQSGAASNQLFNIHKGQLNIHDNQFSINTPFRVQFFKTHPETASNNISITHNTIKNFHGGIFLQNSNSAKVNDNTFANVSHTNIYASGRNCEFKHNIITFAGNLASGDAFNIENADGIKIVDNAIESSAGYGILINGAQNVTIQNNKILDGQTYAINIKTPTVSDKVKAIRNNNILILNNYIAQNRYGLTGGAVDNLVVNDNTFIQRFLDTSTRKHWTNNDVLLPIATNMTWSDNLYKEAFTQEVPGDNSLTLQFVKFPRRGGVTLP